MTDLYFVNRIVLSLYIPVTLLLLLLNLVSVEQFDSRCANVAELLLQLLAGRRRRGWAVTTINTFMPQTILASHTPSHLQSVNKIQHLICKT